MSTEAEENLAVARRKNSAELFELLNRLAHEEAQLSERSEERRTEQRLSHKESSQHQSGAEKSAAEVVAKESQEGAESASGSSPGQLAGALGTKVSAGSGASLQAAIPGSKRVSGSAPSSRKAAAGRGLFAGLASRAGAGGPPETLVLAQENGEGSSSREGDESEARGFLSVLKPGRQPVRRQNVSLEHHQGGQNPARKVRGGSRGESGQESGRTDSPGTAVDAVFRSSDHSSDSRGRSSASPSAKESKGVEAASKRRSSVRGGRDERKTSSALDSHSGRKVVRIRRDDSLEPDFVSREDASAARRSVRTASASETSGQKLSSSVGASGDSGDLSGLPFPYSCAAFGGGSGGQRSGLRSAASSSFAQTSGRVPVEAKSEEGLAAEVAAGTQSVSALQTATTPAVSSQAVPSAVGRAVAPELSARSELEESAEGGDGDSREINTDSKSVTAAGRARKVLTTKRRSIRSPARGGRETEGAPETVVSGAPLSSAEEPAAKAVPEDQPSAFSAEQETSSKKEGQEANKASRGSMQPGVSSGSDPLSDLTAPERSAKLDADRSSELRRRLVCFLEFLFSDEFVRLFRRPLEVRFGTLLVASSVLVVIVILAVLNLQQNFSEPVGPGPMAIVPELEEIENPVAGFVVEGTVLPTAGSPAEPAAVSPLESLEIVTPEPSATMPEIRNVERVGAVAENSNSTVDQKAPSPRVLTPESGRHFVQVQAVLDDESLVPMAKYISHLGFAGKICKRPMANPRLYCLMLGPFQLREAAERAQVRFERLNERSPYKKAPRRFRDCFVWEWSENSRARLVAFTE